MYLFDTYRGVDEVRRRGTALKPSGPGMDPTEIAGCDRLEVHASSFSDPGPDFTEWRFFRGEAVVAVGIVPGY